VSAHNQRGLVAMTVGMTRFVWIEDLIGIAEESGSSPLFALMKREDEKFVTERAYANPRFVEDVVREAALRLDRIPACAGTRSRRRTSRASTTTARTR